ncbi:hypothetical protein Trydic_g20096 [Trypoxylus dichotomus]
MLFGFLSTWGIGTFLKPDSELQWAGYPRKRDASVLAAYLVDRDFNVSQQVICTSESRQTIVQGTKDAHTIRDDETRYGIYQNLLNCNIGGHQFRGEDGGVLVKDSCNKDFVLRAKYSKG